MFFSALLSPGYSPCDLMQAVVFVGPTITDPVPAARPLQDFNMYVTGTKCEGHCLNISRDILDLIFFYCFSETVYDVIVLLICIIQKRQYLQNKKR